MVKQDSRERSRFPPQQAWSEQDCNSRLLVPLPAAKSKQQRKNNNNIHNTMVTAGYPIPGIDFRGCTLTLYSAFSVSFYCLQRHWFSSRTLARAALASSPVFISLLLRLISHRFLAKDFCIWHTIPSFFYISHSLRTACP
jgi:hypothetical protein